MAVAFSEINKVISEYKKSHDKFIEYGTAGFRTDADLLEHIVMRMGILAVLRSMKTQGTVGLMITASHNPESDNGIKIVDPSGEMLETSWESIATKVGNIDDKDLIALIVSIIEEQNIDTNVEPRVMIGRDLRKSSHKLSKAAMAGVQGMPYNTHLTDYGIVTTPMLHYFLVSVNSKINNEKSITHNLKEYKEHKYGVPSIEGYFTKIGNAFNAVRGSQEKNQGKYIGELQLDAANGVGFVAIELFQKHLDNNLTINVFNNGREGELNYMCGADYVKISQKPPVNVPQIPNARCVSIDGDADRIVYYYIDEANKFHLLDGDKIATLIADYFKKLLQESGLNLQLALVQTAYANGSSTEYITKVLQVPVYCVPTGVKHLHHKAKEFDIGVYFEANGHGTVIFSEQATTIIKQNASNERLLDNKRRAAEKLMLMLDMINQTVGDALSDMLLVETILHAKGWDLQSWEKCYKDLPCMQLKVKVNDRRIICTSDAERQCDKPEGLQTKINELVVKYNKSRAFVRPSGTEDVVRVYAEAETELEVQKLATEVALAVYEMAGGVGPKPVLAV